MEKGFRASFLFITDVKSNAREGRHKDIWAKRKDAVILNARSSLIFI